MPGFLFIFWAVEFLLARNDEYIAVELRVIHTDTYKLLIDAILETAKFIFQCTNF